MNYRTNFRSIRDEVSAEEWQVRVDLAACYRLVDYYGMTDLTYNHITARVPGPKHHILINLYGLTYKEITASSLAKIDLDGEVIWKPDTDYYVNRAGYVIHGAIHRARQDVTAVLHTHTRAGMAVAAMRCGLLPLSQTSIRFEGHIGYHDYEGPAVELAERERLVKNLGSHDAMILKNHGLLTCGATIQQAFPVPARARLSHAGRRHGRAHRAQHSLEGSAGENRASLSTRNAAALRRPGMAGDAAAARGGAKNRRLSALLGLTGGASFGLKILHRLHLVQAADGALEFGGLLALGE
jgi:ribulose-5-phosphate 4-epimerase/fuculose-1-phosphate aldolase